MAQHLAVMASGGGSNFRAILHAIEAGTLPLRCPLLVSNRSSAGALKIAESHGVTAVVINPAAYEAEADYVAALMDLFARHQIDLVALAGYLKKVPVPVVRAFRHRMVNIHPALLPDFGGPGLYGLRVHAAVLAAGARQSGATIHFVDEEYDTGPCILQEQVPVLADDTPQTLAARVLAVEHKLYPKALALLAQDRIRVNGRVVTIFGA